MIGRRRAGSRLKCNWNEEGGRAGGVSSPHSTAKLWCSGNWIIRSDMHSNLDRSRYFCLGCRVFLTFDAVGSAFYTWLNGKLIGYSQDSCLPAEFDVTDALQPGFNVVAVQVLPPGTSHCDFALMRSLLTHSTPVCCLAKTQIASQVVADYNQIKASMRRTVQCDKDTQLQAV